MAEDLEPADVEAYTNGRLSASDPETARALAAALARVRRFCGWHVTPVLESDVITLDGSGNSWLALPTLKVVALNTITEQDRTGLAVAVDPVNIQLSAESPGLIRKKLGRAWTYGWSTIVVDFDHGYTADEAPDFRDIVLKLVDQASLNVGTGGQGPLTQKRVDDVIYRWSAVVDRLFGGFAKDPLSESVLYQYRLLGYA